MLLDVNLNHVSLPVWSKGLRKSCCSLFQPCYRTLLYHFQWVLIQKGWLPLARSSGSFTALSLVNFCSLSLPKWTEALLLSHYIKKNKNWTHWFTLMVVCPSLPTHDKAFRLPGKPATDSPFVAVTCCERHQLCSVLAWCSAGCWQFQVVSPSESWVKYCSWSLCPGVSLRLRVWEERVPQPKVMHFLPFFWGFHFHVGPNPP